MASEIYRFLPYTYSGRKLCGGAVTKEVAHKLSDYAGVYSTRIAEDRHIVSPMRTFIAEIQTNDKLNLLPNIHRIARDNSAPIEFIPTDLIEMITGFYSQPKNTPPKLSEVLPKRNHLDMGLYEILSYINAGRYRIRYMTNYEINRLSLLSYTLYNGIWTCLGNPLILLHKNYCWYTKYTSEQIFIGNDLVKLTMTTEDKTETNIEIINMHMIPDFIAFLRYNCRNAHDIYAESERELCRREGLL